MRRKIIVALGIVFQGGLTRIKMDGGFNHIIFLAFSLLWCYCNWHL